MKGKIAIITLYGNFNFGNRLQAFAVQTYFEKLGFSVSIIPNQGDLKRFAPYEALKRLLYHAAHAALWPTKYEKTRRKHLSQNKERRDCIASFSDEYLKEEPVVNYNELDVDLKNRYDYFVTGSDQVWHGWENNCSELAFFFLAFAEPSQRITIAPSFGFDRFPDEAIDAYRKGLEGFEYLSVREERGAELIRELVGKDAVVLLDPTMLIDVSEWLKIIKRPEQYAGDDYIFAYFLDGFKGEVKERVYGLADELGIRVVDVMDIDSGYYAHTRPDEFLYWIHNAKLIVTDSFHASVFSILFGRPFVAADRASRKGSMGSRLDTLLEKFGLEDRRYEAQKQSFLDESARDELFAAHYDAVPGILEAERGKAREFYQKCFHQA